MIPAEHKHAVISSGIDFMRSITRAFGTDVGLQLWDTISTTLDPCVKGDIFFAMLTGGIGSEITIHTAPVTIGKVTLIKIIREITGMGLKDAKDQADTVVPILTQLQSSKPITLTVLEPKDREKYVKQLRDVGCHVT